MCRSGLDAAKLGRKLSDATALEASLDDPTKETVFTMYCSGMLCRAFEMAHERSGYSYTYPAAIAFVLLGDGRPVAVSYSLTARSVSGSLKGQDPSPVAPQLATDRTLLPRAWKRRETLTPPMHSAVGGWLRSCILVRCFFLFFLRLLRWLAQNSER